MIFNWIQAQAVKLLGGALLVALLAIPIHGCSKYREGRESVQIELREAEAKATAKAETARTRIEREAAINDAIAAQEALDQIEAIEQAEAEDRNPLDGMF